MAGRGEGALDVSRHVLGRMMEGIRGSVLRDLEEWVLGGWIGHFDEVG